MIADIEAGKIGCVITKDLSRLGRNYIEAGSYIEIFFPKHNVLSLSKKSSESWAFSHV